MDETSIKPKRSYTTLSISHEVKKELESIIYSSGKAQTCNDLLKELISLKKMQLELAANKAMAKLAKKPEVIQTEAKL